MAHVKAFYEAKKVLKMASLASQGKVKGSKSKTSVSRKTQSSIAMEEEEEEEVIRPVVAGGSDSSADAADAEEENKGGEEEEEEEEVEEEEDDKGAEMEDEEEAAEVEDDEEEDEVEKGADDLQIGIFSDSCLDTAVSSSSRSRMGRVSLALSRVSSALPLGLRRFSVVGTPSSTAFRGASVADGPSLSSSSRSATRYDLRDAMDDTDDNDHVIGTSLIFPGARAGDEEEEMEVEEEEEEEEEGANHLADGASVSTDVIDGDDFDEND